MSRRTWSSLPHIGGGWAPGGGGGAKGFMAANIRPMNPSGVQLSSPMVPPGRVTRSSSSAARWWCGANITPRHEITASNAASPYGSASASPSSQRTVTPTSAASRRPASKSSGVRSDATTSAPARAAGMAALPDPAATSSTRWPRPIPAARTSSGPRSQIRSSARWA